MIKILITQDPNTIQVEYQGQTHTATWNDEEELFDVVGNSGILRASLLAWTGQEGSWEISSHELEATSQGHWTA